MSSERHTRAARKDLAQLLANPDSAGSAAALAAGLGEKAPGRAGSTGSIGTLGRRGSRFRFSLVTVGFWHIFYFLGLGSGLSERRN